MLSRRSIFLGGASIGALALAGCKHTGGADINGVLEDVLSRLEAAVTAAQQFARGLCSNVIPTFTTLSSIVIAIAGAAVNLPKVADAINSLAQQAASTFCNAVAQKVAQGVQPRLTGKRASLKDARTAPALAGAPIISYGPVIINKKPVAIEVIGA